MPKSRKRKSKVRKGPTRSKRSGTPPPLMGPGAPSLDRAAGSGSVDWSGGRKSSGGGPLITFGGIAAVLLIAGGVWFWSTVQESNAFEELAAAGRDVLGQVESFPDRGRRHLGPGETVNYGTSFPTSGDHDPFPTNPGVYTAGQPPTQLVHALEHGNIVIYYDRPLEPDMATLLEWSKFYRGTWDGLVVTPSRGLGESLVFTAWTKRLKMDKLNRAHGAAFIDKYRGRGPERPVR